jgi:hypothetical protein
MDQMNGRELKPGRDWRVIVEAQVKSGQTAAGFCREHGIGYTNFLYHRDKLQKTNRPEVAMKRASRLVPMTRQGSFLPIKLEGGSGIRLRFPGGLVVESEELPATAWVVEVARRWNSEEASC